MAPRGPSQHGETRGYADASDAHNGGSSSSSSSSSSCASSNGRTVSSREAETANGRSSTTSSSASVGGGGGRQIYDSSSTSCGLPAAKPQAAGRDLEGARLLQHMQQHSEDDDDDMEHHEGGGEHSMNAEARAGGADTGKFQVALIRMLEECPSVVRWERGSLYVMDPVALQETVLPRFFRTARYESFLRQLHMYNFRKVEGKGRWNPAVYSHPSLRGTSDMSAIMDLRPRIRMGKVGGVKTKQASSAAANGGGGGGGAAASGAASPGSGGEGGRSSTLSSGGGGSSARFAAQAPAAGAGMPEAYVANMQGAEVAGAAAMAPGMIPFQQGMFAGGMYPQHSPFAQFAGGYGTLGEPTTQLQLQMLSAYGAGYPYLRQLGMPSEPTTAVFSPTGAAAPAFAAAHAGYASGLYTQPFLAYSAGFAPAVQGSTHMPVMQAAPQYATVSYVDPSQQVAARHAAPQPVHPAFALAPAAASSDGSGSEQGTTSRSSAALESDASRHRDGARRRGGGSDAVKQESTRGSSSSSSKQQHTPPSATSPASGGAHAQAAVQRQLHGQQQGAPHKQQRQRRSSKVAQPSALAAAAAAGPNERSGSSSSNGSGSSATTASGDGSGRRANSMASGSGGSSVTGPFADSALAAVAAGRMPPMMLPRAAFAEAALHPATMPLQALPPAMLAAAAAAAGQGVPLHYAHQHLWGGGGVPQPGWTYYHASGDQRMDRDVT